jgi:hypothetical protein
MVIYIILDSPPRLKDSSQNDQYSNNGLLIMGGNSLTMF